MLQKFKATFTVDLPDVDVTIGTVDKPYDRMTFDEKSAIVYVLATILKTMQTQLQGERDNGKKE